MATRIRVGIIFENNENWIGGSYYILNLIASCKTLPDSLQPLFVILTQTNKDFDLVKQTGYPFLEHRNSVTKPVKHDLFKRIVNKIQNILIGYDRYPQSFTMNTSDLEVLFPASPGVQMTENQKKIYWIPDFQEIHYPHFFSKSQIIDRMQNHRFISQTRDNVIFSSEQAKGDFFRLFPDNTNKIFTLPFAVTHPKSTGFDAEELKRKYGIRNSFYIAPNQFWVHKNQRVIIEAAYLLNKRNQLNFQIIFTGKEYDKRNPDYADALKISVNKLKLNNEIKFLGFIPREDQLNLIKISLGVIQPSLFEGWSTVIEDAKALEKFIFASDLPVHREQAQTNIEFFDPLEPNSLAKLLASPPRKVSKTEPYFNSIKRFAKGFAAIVNP